MREPVFGGLRPDKAQTIGPVQLKELARVLAFRTYQLYSLYYLRVKLISNQCATGVCIISGKPEVHLKFLNGNGMW